MVVVHCGRGLFFYAFAWVPLSVWTYRVLLWKFNAGQFSLAFVCWVFVYGHVSLAHALLGTDTCFNQRTGEPTKWYVQDAAGRIVLFDSGGFDTATGAAKQPVTTQICTAFERQEKNDIPRRITVDVRQVDFLILLPAVRACGLHDQVTALSSCSTRAGITP